jgi:hypothetical protein
MLFLIVILPLSILLPQRRHKQLSPYMCGMTTNADQSYSGSIGLKRDSKLSNYYLTSWFGEVKLQTLGVYVCTGLIAVMFVAGTYAGVIV